MTLLDVKTVLLQPVSTNVVANQSLYIFTKAVPSGSKWLQSSYIGDE